MLVDSDGDPSKHWEGLMHIDTLGLYDWTGNSKDWA